MQWITNVTQVRVRRCWVRFVFWLQRPLMDGLPLNIRPTFSTSYVIKVPVKPFKFAMKIEKSNDKYVGRSTYRIAFMRFQAYCIMAIESCKTERKLCISERAICVLCFLPFFACPTQRSALDSRRCCHIRFGPKFEKTKINSKEQRTVWPRIPYYGQLDIIYRIPPPLSSRPPPPILSTFIDENRF